MCVIAIAVEKLLDEKTLNACSCANPDGMGVAWAERNLVHWIKGTHLTVKDLMAAVANKPLPHIFHFRIASVGRVQPELCHPFPVRKKNNFDLTGECGAALFHNGTIHNWRMLADVAGVGFPKFASDSMVVARIVALRGKKILEHVSEANKFAIMNKDGSINLVGRFDNRDGAVFSNLYWTYRAEQARSAHYSSQGLRQPIKPENYSYYTSKPVGSHKGSQQALPNTAEEALGKDSRKDNPYRHIEEMEPTDEEMEAAEIMAQEAEGGTGKRIHEKSDAEWAKEFTGNHGACAGESVEQVSTAGVSLPS